MISTLEVVLVVLFEEMVESRRECNFRYCGLFDYRLFAHCPYVPLGCTHSSLRERRCGQKDIAFLANHLMIYSGYTGFLLRW